ncbi:MAG: hypothetical protein HFI37_07025 [Lachnospiraceae bacterium]|jgi:flagellar biosynthesis/type III secretory pathway M-ring protein FliF/YscJ|nr:hypothetical protein [Lachnospiraceae bacterium]
MNTKSIPAVVMLTAGFATCVIAIYTHMELSSFTKSLLTVLIIFYMFGFAIKIVLDRNFKEESEEEEEAKEEEEGVSEEQSDDEEDESEEISEISEEEQEEDLES